jgi:hypothetical protein
MIEEWTDPYDRILASAVFGTDRVDEAERMIRAWARTRGFGDGRVSSVELSVGAAVTLQLATGKIFVKVWSGEADPKALSAQLQVQAGLAACGFPAPRVLTDLSPLGPGWATAMEYKRDGVATDVRVPGVRRAMAAGLSHFVRVSQPYRDIEGLRGSCNSSAPRPIWQMPRRSRHSSPRSGASAGSSIPSAHSPAPRPCSPICRATPTVSPSPTVA